MRSILELLIIAGVTAFVHGVLGLANETFLSTIERPAEYRHTCFATEYMGKNSKGQTLTSLRLRPCSDYQGYREL